jgi:hypothetical protein
LRVEIRGRRDLRRDRRERCCSRGLDADRERGEEKFWIRELREAAVEEEGGRDLGEVGGLDSVGEGVELGRERVRVGDREKRLAQVLIDGERLSECIGEAGGCEGRWRAAVTERQVVAVVTCSGAFDGARGRAEAPKFEGA